MQKASEHPFDERSKTFYTQYFKNKKIRAGRQFEVFSRGQSMDIGVTIDPSEIFEKIMELFNMNVQIRPETAVKFDRFLKERPEFIMQMPTLRDAIRQGQLFGEAVGEERGEKRGEKWGKMLGILQAEQNMLVRLLHRKFADLPESVVINIEQTNDTDQLEAWTDQILVANTWQEMFEGSISA